MRLLDILRDNAAVNAVMRRALRPFISAAPSLGRSLSTRYRIYGDVELSFRDSRFRMHAEADDHFATALYYQTPYETRELTLVQERVRSCTQFVDIGANTGVFSLVAAASAPGLKVTAIEPAPNNARRLRRNRELNPALDIRVEAVALGETTGEVPFAVPCGGQISTVSSANVAFSSRFHKVDYETINVPVTRLDDLFADRPLGTNDLLKIDVETYELPVLRGAERTLEAGPDVLIEIWHPDVLAQNFPHLAGTVAPGHMEQVESLFRANGYEAYGLEPEGIIPISSLIEQRQRVNYFFSRRRFAGFTRYTELAARG